MNQTQTAAVTSTELFRTSKSWDGAELPDYPVGRPELVARRLVFPVGCRLALHSHPVINFGVVRQGELTIIDVNGKEKAVREGEALVEMVNTAHYGENRGDKTVILDMFYLAQAGIPLSQEVC